MAGSQFGVMLFPDMPKGVAEMARVVRPGGRVLINAYADPHAIEFLGVFVEAVQAAVPSFEGPPMDPLPLPFQLHDPERLRQVLADAGLDAVEVETISERTEFSSGEHLWDWLLHSNPIVAEILGELDLTEEQRALVREAAVRVGPAVLTAPINIGIGTQVNAETARPRVRRLGQGQPRGPARPAPPRLRARRAGVAPVRRHVPRRGRGDLLVHARPLAVVRRVHLDPRGPHRRRRPDHRPGPRPGAGQDRHGGGRPQRVDLRVQPRASSPAAASTRTPRCCATPSRVRELLSWADGKLTPSIQLHAGE